MSNPSPQVRARLAAQKKKKEDKKSTLSAAALAEAKARKAKEKKKRDKTHHNQVSWFCVEPDEKERSAPVVFSNLNTHVGKLYNWCSVFHDIIFYPVNRRGSAVGFASE